MPLIYSIKKAPFKEADFPTLTICEIEITGLKSFEEQGAEETETIFFKPPIYVSLYKNEVIQGKSAEVIIQYNSHFDFGLDVEFSGELPQTLRKESLGKDDWYQALINWLEFELDHSFFHTSYDPNYSTLNYALFGCLCLGGRARKGKIDGEPIKELP